MAQFRPGPVVVFSTWPHFVAAAFSSWPGVSGVFHLRTNCIRADGDAPLGQPNKRYLYIV